MQKVTLSGFQTLADFVFLFFPRKQRDYFHSLACLQCIQELYNFSSTKIVKFLKYQWTGMGRVILVLTLM